MGYQELSNEQRRQLIDAQQVYGGYCRTEAALEAMPRLRWQSSKGQRYLYEAKGKVRKSLGAESEELKVYKAQEDEKRAGLEDSLKGLEERLDKMAPVNRALGLGRMPRIASRIVRALDKEGLLGKHIIVAGTNALFGYEIASGVLIGSEYVATGDADLVWDTAQALQLVGTGIKREGLMGLLQRIDQSFVADYGFNARNRDGYMVDLLCPDQEGNPQIREEGDLAAVPMAGIAWLLEAPREEQVIIGEDGYPLRLVVPESRSFALHKMWVSKRADRDPLKRQRDRDQAAVIAELAVKFQGKALEAGDMPWLPDALRGEIDELTGRAGK
jgi:hypothetical protein